MNHPHIVPDPARVWPPEGEATTGVRNGLSPPAFACDFRAAPARPSSTLADGIARLLYSARNLDVDGLRASAPPAPPAGATARAFGPASPRTWR